MRCDEVFQKLSDYLDGALAGPLGEELVRHLQECVPCADVRKDRRRSSVNPPFVNSVPLRGKKLQPARPSL